MTTLKILCVKDGISITHNGHEKNIETIFGFNTSNNLIQNFTFQCYIKPDAELYNKLLNSKKETVKNACLFYSYRYQISFAHFCCSTLPKLIDFFEIQKTIPDLKLLVPKHHYNNFVKDIFSHCGIDLSSIILLEDNTIYTIESFYKTRTFSCIPDNFSKDHINIFSLIRQSIPVSPCVPRRRIYLKRDGVANSEFGNSETGIIRKIINEEELILSLKSVGFEIITLGNKSICEKYELLKDAEYIITQIGANCMNLTFTNAPKNLILLSSDVTFGEFWYSNFSSELNEAIINTKVLYYKSDCYDKDPTNRWNNPFKVDIEEILELVKM